MAHQFKWIRRVQFAETDMAGIVHFSMFFQYMEQCEHAFYRSLGFSVIDRDRENELGWPRISAKCDFKKPFHFEDEMEIELLVREKRSRGISYDFLFRKHGEELIRAHGFLAVVCVSGDPAGKMKAVPIPEAISKLLQAAPRELLPEAL